MSSVEVDRARALDWVGRQAHPASGCAAGGAHPDAKTEGSSRWQHRQADGERVSTTTVARAARQTPGGRRVVDAMNGRNKKIFFCTAVEDGTKGFVLQWKTVQNPD